MWEGDTKKPTQRRRHSLCHGGLDSEDKAFTRDAQRDEEPGAESGEWVRGGITQQGRGGCTWRGACPGACSQPFAEVQTDRSQEETEVKGHRPFQQTWCPSRLEGGRREGRAAQDAWSCTERSLQPWGQVMLRTVHQFGRAAVGVGSKGPLLPHPRNARRGGKAPAPGAA